MLFRLYMNYCGTSSFPNPSFLNTIEPTNPASAPPTAPIANARITFIGSLNANGASIPGIGEAVPGALFTIPRTAAQTPAKAPPKKLLP